MSILDKRTYTITTSGAPAISSNEDPEYYWPIYERINNFNNLYLYSFSFKIKTKFDITSQSPGDTPIGIVFFTISGVSYIFFFNNTDERTYNLSRSSLNNPIYIDGKGITVNIAAISLEKYNTGDQARKNGDTTAPLMVNTNNSNGNFYYSGPDSNDIEINFYVSSLSNIMSLLEPLPSPSKEYNQVTNKLINLYTPYISGFLLKNETTISKSIIENSSKIN